MVYKLRTTIAKIADSNRRSEGGRDRIRPKEGDGKSEKLGGDRKVGGGGRGEGSEWVREKERERERERLGQKQSFNTMLCSAFFMKNFYSLKSLNSLHHLPQCKKPSD